MNATSGLTPSARRRRSSTLSCTRRDWSRANDAPVWHRRLRVLFVRRVGNLGRFRVGVFVLNAQPHFFPVYCSTLGSVDAQMNLATPNLEHLQLDVIVDHDRLASTPG